jgi:hypothetical protein
MVMMYGLVTTEETFTAKDILTQPFNHINITITAFMKWANMIYQL